MPNRTQLREMTKPQLIDFGCGFFDDTGNLRQELGDMKKDDLLELLFDNDADAPDEVEEPKVEVKTTRPSNKDLGNW